MSAELIPITLLTPHPLNSYYFDDITGDNWEDFLQSIKTSGITNAITIDNNNVIISGHQRVRACKVLGIAEIPYIRITYSDEELSGDYPKDIKDLIESNLKQRTSGNNNPFKLGKCIKFLEGYYGIRLGNNQVASAPRIGNNFPPSKTQTAIAQDLNISVKSLRNYKKLAESIPEMEELVTTGIISATTAMAIVRQLPEDQQRVLADELIGTGEHISEKRVGEIIESMKRELDLRNSQIKELNNKVASLEANNATVDSPAEVEYLRSELATYKKEVEILRSRSTSAEGRDANVAYTFWQATKTYIDTVLAPMLYDDLVVNNQNNSCASHIIDACTKVIYAAEDVLKRFKAPTIIDIE